MESSPNISNWPVEGLGRESQEDGVRSRPAESATGLMKKTPHRGRVTVWPSLLWTQTATSASMVAGGSIVSASSLSDAGEDGPAIIDVSKLTTVKVLNKRSRSSGVEYKCEFEPLWLAADLAERAQMGTAHIRSYENGLVRDRRLKTLRVGKRKFSEM